MSIMVPSPSNFPRLTTFLATSSAFSLDSRDGEDVVAALGFDAELLYDRKPKPVISWSLFMTPPSLLLLALGRGCADPIAVEMLGMALFVLLMAG